MDGSMASGQGGGESEGEGERERERADERVARESQAESYIAPTTLIVYWERTLKD